MSTDIVIVDNNQRHVTTHDKYPIIETGMSTKACLSKDILQVQQATCDVNLYGPC